MAGLTVLDASILLAHFDDTDPHAEDARTILLEADELAVSTLTLAEVMVGAARAQRLEEQRLAIAELEIEEVPIAAGAAAVLARLRAATDLRLPDCCVLHAAEVADADAIATRDKRLAAVAQARGLRTP